MKSNVIFIYTLPIQHVKWLHKTVKQLLLKSMNSDKAKVHIYVYISYSYFTHCGFVQVMLRQLKSLLFYAFMKLN